jgi:signal peptidase I
MVLSTVFLSSYRQDSDSMNPTLNAGDRVFVSPLLYGPRLDIVNWVLPGITEPRHGDLALVRPGYMRDMTGLQRVVNPFVRFGTLERVRTDDGDEWRSAFQVKRVIGLPGDTVRMERFVAYVRPAGESGWSSEFELSESEYDIVNESLPEGWQGDDIFGDAMSEVTLGPEEYFVLSDHRTRGVDSRYWGPIDEASLRGRVILRYWPLRDAGRP